MIKRKKGFTIVELLGVFILLGIIAIIITPSILNLQEDAEKDAFEQSVNALIRSAQVYHANNDFINFPSNGISPSDPNLELKNDEKFNSGVVKLINEEYFYAYNISNGKYCANGVRNDLSIEEGECPDTPSRCFEFDEETGTIIDFYDDKVGCDIPNPIIPEEIDDVPVEHIGEMSFAKGIFVCEKWGKIYDEDDPSIDYEYYEDYVIFDIPNEKTEALEEVEQKFDTKYSNKTFTDQGSYCFVSDTKPNGYRTLTGQWENGQNYNQILVTYSDYIDKTNYPNRLTGVTLPETIKTIDYGAFKNNDIAYTNFENLTNLELISEAAFLNNELKTVDLSNSTKLTGIDVDAFCTNKITSINLGNLENLVYLETHAFAFNQLKNVEIKDLPNLEYIDMDAFYTNNISSLVIENVPKLYYLSGFDKNSITTFEFDHLKSLQYIGSWCFGRNKLTHISIANLPLLESIGYSAFDTNTTLSSLNIQNLPELLYIDSDAFFENTNLKSLEIKNAPKLEAIYSYAFCKTGLTNITFTNANNIIYLGYYLFNNTKITSFDFSIFPKLKTIDYHVMSQTGWNLKEITINNPELEYIGHYAFDYNYGLKTVNMGENPSLTTMELGVFKWSGVDNIVIPKNVTFIGDLAYHRTVSKALSVTVLGDDPTRFNSRWQALGLSNGGGSSNICPTIPTDGSTNTVTCS